MAPTTVVAFDLYGTLLSTESIAHSLAKMYGEDNAKAIASKARTYQLEYTWRINSMGQYVPFDTLTRASFRQAATEIGVAMTGTDADKVMDAYNGLETFPEVADALQTLASTPSVMARIFSNGTEDMVATSLRTSPSLSSGADAGVLDAATSVISVDPLRLYKPDPRVYKHMVEQTLGNDATQDEDGRGRVWLVSSNTWDVLGARVAGLESAWVDRAGLGWVDGLGEAMGVQPTVVVRGVDEAVNEILRRSGQN